MVGLCLLSTVLSAQESYKNPQLTPSERAKDLLQRLTLEEKVGLMQNSSKPVFRLDIKAYDWWSEALHGIARAGKATVFPQAIGMAASFDDSLLYKVFDAVSDEARVKYRQFSSAGQHGRYQGLTVWTPNINIFRDPRWGRGQETYGEDPYLTSTMGQAVVRGLQGRPKAGYDKLHACAKHFAVHSGPEWNRHTFNAEKISPRDLWETYLPAFKDLVQKADVKEVMCAYNSFEGEPCCGSNRLLMQILRDEWNYKNLVVSDCGAINDIYMPVPKGHGAEPDEAHASARAVASGTDVECGSVYRNLSEAVSRGLINEDKIDKSVYRLLKARFELGEMDDPELVPWMQLKDNVINSPEHQQLALQMARESMVLLQNKNNILPLSRQLKVAVMGPNAADSVAMWGNYNGFPYHTTTVLEGIKKLVGTDRVIYTQGCDCVSDVSLSSLFNQCTLNGKAGFQAIYWGNTEFKGDPVAEDWLTTPLNFSAAGGTVFARGVPLSHFSARYHSVFTAEESGKIDFYVKLNGYYKLFVDGVQQSEGKYLSLPTNVYSLDVKSGKSYDIRLDYSSRYDGVLDFDLGKEVAVNLEKAVASVESADVVVFVGGISPRLEGEEMAVKADGFKGGDRTNIELPAVQRKLLEKLHHTGKKVVFVNCSGSAIGLVPETRSCDAILQAWYPGQAAGTAVADVLFGNYNPAGRLPITFYKNISQLPDFEDYSMKGRTYRYFKGNPLFAFGYGLSYTTFTYGKASLTTPVIDAGDSITLSIPVTNAGKRDGEEVVQVYLSRPGDVNGPVKTLRAFRRIFIKSGESHQLNITLSADDLQWFDEKSNTMRCVPGEYKLLYGGSSIRNDLKEVGFVIQ
ncbi:MAG: glycoside hydrolase family 3 C-terminal domain-containing protein [Bacteroides sp.]|nr:glycoside hydrolase family 3 C-terminal domain-containing protein [Bacteroides sp.]